MVSQPQIVPSVGSPAVLEIYVLAQVDEDSDELDEGTLEEMGAAGEESLRLIYPILIGDFPDLPVFSIPEVGSTIEVAYNPDYYRKPRNVERWILAELG